MGTKPRVPLSATRPGPAKLREWCKNQNPPWNLEFLAKVVGAGYSTMSKYWSDYMNGKPTYQVAKKIELITEGQVTVDDMMLSPQELDTIYREIEVQWNGFKRP